MAERLELSEENGVTVVHFKDSKILDEADIQQLGQELSALVESGEHAKLLLNFEKVDFLSSAALGKLISVKKKAKLANIDLKLCSIKQNLMEVFKLTNLDQVFEIFDTQDGALMAFDG